MASIRHLVVILYRPCVSNFDSAYSIFMQPRNFLKLIFFSFYFLLSDSYVYAGNIKMPDKTNEIVINWISEHHKAKKNEIRLFMPSKKTFKTCHTGLELKKTKNKKIIKLSCDNPNWTTQIRYAITNAKKQYIGYIFQKNLPVGHKIEEHDIEMSVFQYSASSFEQNPAKILGKFTSKATSKGDRIRKSILSEPARVVQTKNYIAEGELIEKSDINEIEIGSDQINSQNILPFGKILGAKAKKNLTKGTIFTRGDILLPFKAVVTNQKLLRNNTISKENVSVKTFWGRKPTGALTTTHDLENVEVTRSLRIGEIIKINDLRAAKLVKKGDIVTLTYERNSLQLVVTLESLEDGRLGEKIRLVNPESGEIILGKVSGRGTADMWR